MRSANPNAWNVYDSLAEAYMANGEKDLAIANYKKSLELNPNNASAVAALKKAGLAHAPFDPPAPDQLQAVMKRVDELKGEEAIAFAFREGFAGVAARAAMPKLQQTIREFRPDLVIRESAEFASLIAAEAAGVPQAGVAVYCSEYESGRRHPHFNFAYLRTHIRFHWRRCCYIWRFRYHRQPTYSRRRYWFIYY